MLRARHRNSLGPGEGSRGGEKDEGAHRNNLEKNVDGR